MIKVKVTMIVTYISVRSLRIRIETAAVMLSISVAVAVVESASYLAFFAPLNVPQLSNPLISPPLSPLPGYRRGN